MNILCKCKPPHTNIPSTNFPICSVSHFYICNPCSVVILLLHASLKREKLIFRSEKGLSDANQISPPPDKDICVDFSTGTKRVSEHALVWMGALEEESSQPPFAVSAYQCGRNKFTIGRKMLSWWLRKHGQK
ncbi:hypothetical protein ILYODFUR_008683 [Ilyodon furcidens]|uniref:Uncharacterized protein n=1 Tax=Ilyodon furcidens TaxID=33524 RepID=A0ABV0USG1_9TELE